MKRINLNDPIQRKRLRAELLIKTDRKCPYCGVQISHTTATFDHILPRSKGGTDDKDNIIVCCRRCNVKKDDSYVEWFKCWVGGFYNEAVIN